MKSNFRRYGQMKSTGGKSQRREEKRRRKKIREEKESEKRRCRCVKRKKSRKSLRFSDDFCAKAAGAEPAGQMRDEQLHAVVARSTFRSQNVQNTTSSEHFLEVKTSFRVAGARDCAPCQSEQNVRVL